MEPTTRVAVNVTFLRMDQAPTEPAPPLPEGVQVVRVRQPSLVFYRYLYDTVGAPHLWWLRRTATDEALTALLRSPAVSLHVLYAGGEPCGFHELDTRPWPDVNLSYFGLVPHCVGRRYGTAFLRHAVDLVWRSGARGMTVNTCTADHPRALPGYLKVGFRPVRQVREEWNVPLRLGMKIPDHLKL